MSPDADSNHVTFPDGDIIIRCNDGAEFRVHSFMLRHSSSYFSNMAALYPKPLSHTTSQTPEPIQMTEGSYVINTFLLLLYDFSSLPEPNYPPDSESRAQLLLAAEKFKFRSRRIDRFFLDYLETLEPLLSWALAVRYGLVDARKQACIRVIHEAIDIPGTAAKLPELDEIPSRTVLRLQAIQIETLKQCQKDLEGITWTCRPHSKTEWVEKKHRMLKTNPLTIPLWGLSGGVAKIAMWSYWTGAECENCRKVYGKNSEDAEARIQRVNKTVEAAADDEALTGN